MDNLNDLKDTWLSAKTNDLPDANMITQIIRPFRDYKVNRKLMIIIVSLVMATFFLVLIYLGDSHMPSTTIAEVMFTLSLLILAYTNIRSIKRFYMLNDCSNREFIHFLEQTRRNQVYYYKRTQVACMILYSFALLFYLYEPVHGSIFLLVTCYSLVIIMLTVFWVVIRPKTYRREADKLEKMIRQTEKLAEQFK